MSLWIFELYDARLSVDFPGIRTFIDRFLPEKVRFWSKKVLFWDENGAFRDRKVSIFAGNRRLFAAFLEFQMVR